MSQTEPPMSDGAELAPAPRFTRGTFLGCVGLFCTLLALPLLWLAVSVSARWASHLLPPLAFVAAIGGAALTLRVPGSQAFGSRDPRRPLTHSGSSPTVERPATAANQMVWALAAALTLGALGGYVLEVAHNRDTLGLSLAIGGGLALLGLGSLVASGRAPAPGLRWLKLSIYGDVTRQSAPLIAIGFITTAGALFSALLDGYGWASLALAALIALVVSVTPLARRLPRRTIPPR